MAHVPKTIDNDLPLPGSTPTFGFETARQLGVRLVRNLTEDARTTSRWYVIVSMGRAAGHLALGIGKAAAATLTIIPEEFRGRQVTLDEVCDIILGSMIKRASEQHPLRRRRPGRRADRRHRRARPAGGDGERRRGRPLRQSRASIRTAICAWAKSSSAAWCWIDWRCF